MKEESELNCGNENANLPSAFDCVKTEVSSPESSSSEPGIFVDDFEVGVYNDEDACNPPIFQHVSKLI